MADLASNQWWALILLGIFAGVASGTLGLGSGIIVIPALVLLYNVEQKAAQGTALAVMVPMAMLGAVRYWRNPQIEMNTAVILLIVLGAMGGVLAGTELAGRLSGPILRKVFAVFLAIVAVKMFTASPKPAKSGTAEDLTSRSSVSLADPGGMKNEAEQ
jgi:hypothetical protein